jgi:NAD+ kinase
MELTRIATSIDGVKIDAPALNDVLVAHPNPAAVSRCTFRCKHSPALLACQNEFDP